MRRGSTIALLATAAAIVGAVVGLGLSLGGAQGGSVSEGRTAFVQSCQGCHPAGGNRAGVGPKLAARGLSVARIRTQIVNGGGSMPSGLVAGDDLTDVVTFVASIQRPRARNLRPTAGVRRALRIAHLNRLPRAQRRGVRGPLTGNRGRPRTQVKWAVFGTGQWAIGTFSRPGRGTRGQPQIFRRQRGRAWRDIGASNGCLSRVPAKVRAAWRVSRGTCR
ncbi:MAG: c-type cytochrome [Miltoncostaeaceae bacterium]